MSKERIMIVRLAARSRAQIDGRLMPAAAAYIIFMVHQTDTATNLHQRKSIRAPAVGVPVAQLANFSTFARAHRKRQLCAALFCMTPESASWPETKVGPL